VQLNSHAVIVPKFKVTGIRVPTATACWTLLKSTYRGNASIRVDAAGASIGRSHSVDACGFLRFVADRLRELEQHAKRIFRITRVLKTIIEY